MQHQTKKKSSHLLVFVLLNRGRRGATQIEHLEGGVAVEVLRKLEILGGLVDAGDLGVPQKLIQNCPLAPPAGRRGAFCYDAQILI